MSRARSKPALAIAILLGVALAVALGVLDHRARTPWRTIPTGHGGIAAIEFVEDGKALAVSHTRVSPPLRVYSVEHGDELMGLIRMQVDTSVYAARSTLAAYLDFRNVKIVDMAKGSGEVKLAFETPWQAAALSQQGETVAVVATDRLELRSTRDGSLTQSFDVPPELARADRVRLALSPRGDRVALGFRWTGPGPHNVHVVTRAWHVGRAGGAFEIPGELVGFSAQDEVVASLGGPNLLEIDAFSPLGTMRAVGRTREPYGKVALSASGERLATYELDEAGRAGGIDVLSLETGALLRRITKRMRGHDYPLALSPDGDKLAIAYPDGTLEVWELPP